LGDGDTRLTDQAFVLKQSPLTYVSADTPSGTASTLQVRVNDLHWTETSSLYGAEADARVYEVRHHDDGSSSVIFGDGIEGGQLPTGTTNVRADYRKYSGSADNLGADTLTTLLQKPLGVTGATNPQASSGGADREQLKDARYNAPLTVLTLDRAVSELDYQRYARAFAGVAKAHALWIDSGPSRGIYITLAGTDGAAIPADSDTAINLMNSLRRYGDPLLPLSLVNYEPAHFLLGLAVKMHEAADTEKVQLALEVALREHFSFDNRDFGQHVSRDEVYAVAHAVEHIEAVRLTSFYKDEPGATDAVENIIAAHLPVASLTEVPAPAEILTLSDDPIIMGAFS
jgi:predicted phage baseplate assembly protein